MHYDRKESLIGERVMHYDRKVFLAFRAKALTDLSQFKVGETYYTNMYGAEKFQLLEIINDVEFYCRFGLPLNEARADQHTFITDADGRREYLCCGDLNIGMSHNPWLVFANEADAQECMQKLPLTWGDWSDCYD